MRLWEIFAARQPAMRTYNPSTMLCTVVRWSPIIAALFSMSAWKTQSIASKVTDFILFILNDSPLFSQISATFDHSFTLIVPKLFNLFINKFEESHIESAEDNNIFNSGNNTIICYHLNNKERTEERTANTTCI